MAIVLTLVIFLVLSAYIATRYAASLGRQFSNILLDQKYSVTGPAMLNTLHNGQYVLVDTKAYLTHNPKRGDVIVFRQPDQPDRELIKRVIGLPGDNVRLDETHVWINNVELHEPYITVPSNPSAISLIVAPNEYFVMGDNRPVSEDSRYFGMVPKDSIVGQVEMAEGPQHQWQPVNTYPDVFANIQ